MTDKTHWSMFDRNMRKASPAFRRTACGIRSVTVLKTPLHFAWAESFGIMAEHTPGRLCRRCLQLWRAKEQTEAEKPSLHKPRRRRKAKP